MEKATKIIDQLIKTLTPPPNASFSESIQCYTKGIELMKKALEDEFNEGYKKAEKDRVAKITRSN